MESESITNIIILIFLLGGSAFFSASETAFTSLNSIRIKSKAQQGDPRASLVLKLKDNYDALISGILIGNNVINVGASTLATILFVRHFPQNGAFLSTMVMTIAVLIFGEITPKSIANQQSEKLARFSAPILNVVVIVFKPLIWLFNKWTIYVSKLFKNNEDSKISDEEILVLINEAEKTGNLSNYEHSLIRSAIKLDDLKVKSILVPRTDVISIDINDPIDKIKREVYCNNYSRIVVFDDSIDNTVGYIHEKDFSRLLLGISDEKEVSEIVSEVLYVYPSERVTRVLSKMQTEQIPFAIIRGEYGEFWGIITMEDILELLVGEIWDETDERVYEAIKNSDGSYDILGVANINEIIDFFNMNIEETYYSQTIGGFFLEQIGRLAEIGDTIQLGNYILKVTEIDDKRIIKLNLTTIKNKI
ncbi:Hemolysin, contains CBS domains [Facklamia miroungae]|uniref:Hemolysin, contains CBS domains n=2 Tax=Facklamia miroungae TaxID=120956 RepID=A0A1G7T8F4_9LACT|nr:Hemolysin, contains CBS domains [Facklamia miroungae]